MLQSSEARVIGTEAAHLGLAGAYLRVQVVDQVDRCSNRPGPWLWDLHGRKPFTAGLTEEIGDPTGMAEGGDGGLDAVLEGCAVPDQVQAEAGPFALGAHPWVGSQI
jgi:hypothetical protein